MAGDQLPSIRELADRLQTKQSVVRDELLKAETLGLIKVQPRAGVFLRARISDAPSTSASRESVFATALESDDQNLFHLLDARRLIEVELAARAASRRRLEDLLPVRRALEALLDLPQESSRAEYVERDIRFHLELARLAGNSTLFAIQQSLLNLLRPHLIMVPHDLQRRSITDQSHAAIYDALLAGDVDRVRTELQGHLSLAYDSLLRDLQQPITAGARFPRSTRVAESAPQ